MKRSLRILLGMLFFVCVSGRASAQGTGACCLCDSSCVDVDAKQCAAQGGTFMGPETDCGDIQDECAPFSPCPGGCIGSGVGIDLMPRVGGTPPPGGIVQVGDMVDYVVTLTQPLPTGCNYHEGQLSVTFPNGVRVEVSGYAGSPDVPVIGFGPPGPYSISLGDDLGIFYAVAESDANNGTLVARADYGSTVNQPAQSPGTVLSQPPTPANSATIAFPLTLEPPVEFMCVDPLDITLKCDDLVPACTLEVYEGFGGQVITDCEKGEITVTCEDSSDGATCPERITREWMFTDGCGNMFSCFQNILINDNVPPVITCPDNVVIECTGPNPADDVPPPDVDSVTATDNCGEATITHVSTEPMEGSCPTIFTRRYRATDSCGNFSECTQKIIIVDSTPPVFTFCPADAVVECGPKECGGGMVPRDMPEIMDLCDPEADFETTEETLRGSCPAERVIIRTFTAVDACGNQAFCSQVIFVDDAQAPTVICPDEPFFVAPGADGQCPAVDNVPVDVSDCCDDPADLTVTAKGIFDPPESRGAEPVVRFEGGQYSIEVNFASTGTATIIVTVVDRCGNTSSCQFEAFTECGGNCDVKLEVEGCIIPPPPPPPGDACDGKVERMEFRYTGEDCSATVHQQDPSKVECDDFQIPLPDMVFVRVSNEDNANDNGAEVYFEGFVDIDTKFEATAQNAGESQFENATFIHVRSGPGGQVLQFIEFHTSCSQPLMPGNQFGSMLVTSMTSTEGGTIDLPGEDDPGDPECIRKIESNPGSCDGKVEVLFLRYTGEDCNATQHNQDPDKVDCSGDPNFAEPVRILVTKDGSNTEVYADVNGVLVGETITASAAMAGEDHFSSQTRVRIFNQSGQMIQDVDFHTSCSQPLRAGDQFGAMFVVAIQSTEGGFVTAGAEVEWVYTITNNGSDEIVSLEFMDAFDSMFDPGDFDPPLPLAMGETTTVTFVNTVTETLTNMVTVIANEDEDCTATDDQTIEIQDPPQACCEDGGAKPRALIMVYTGEDCASSNNGMSGFECEEFQNPLPDTVRIISNDKSDPDDGAIWFDGIVTIGDVYQIDAANAGETKLSGSTYIHILNQNSGQELQEAKLHTSCSQPLMPGDTYGGSELTACIDETGGLATWSPPGDVTGDGVVDDRDVAAVLLGMSTVCERPPAPCPEDVNGDGFVDAADLDAVIRAWRR